MKKQIVAAPAAPRAIGPYSQAVFLDGWLFTSGQVPLDPVAGQLVQVKAAIGLQAVVAGQLLITEQLAQGRGEGRRQGAARRGHPELGHRRRKGVQSPHPPR